MGSIFKNDGKSIILEAPYVEFYIPKFYFETSQGFAEDYAKTVRAIGVFNFGIFENSKLVAIKTFNVPTWIELHVYESEDRTVDLPGQDAVPCKVLKYFKDNIIMESTFIVDSANAELFLKFITDGKLPNSIPYDKTLEIWRKNQEMNDVHFGVSSTILELILAVSYRDKNDLSRKFSKAIGSNLDISQFDYQTASIRQICQYTSTFTALTFEDIDSMITTSLNRSRNKGNEVDSPIERIIKM